MALEEYSEIELLIEHYLQNRSSEEEYLKAIEILKTAYSNHRIRAILREKWQENVTESLPLSEEEKSDIRRVLSDIHHEINLSEEKWDFRSGFRKTANTLMKIAALLFIPLLFSSTWFYFTSKKPYQRTDSFITISTPAGSRIQTELPDGTLVWQNSGSTIRYPKNFTKRNRQVILSGEAYFDVKPDKLHPFFVATATHRIKVTGTRFNVSAYVDEGSVSVALVSGNISAIRLGTGQDREYSLVPGDCLVSLPGKQDFVKHNVPIDKYVSWIEGKLVFRDDPLGEILKKLARWYNVDIELDDPGNQFKDLPFTMTLKDESFLQIIEYISHAAPLVIQEEKMTQQADRSFSRQKYIVRYRK